LIQKLLKTCATKLYSSIAQILNWCKNAIARFNTQVLMPSNYTFHRVWGQTRASRVQTLPHRWPKPIGCGAPYSFLGWIRTETQKSSAFSQAPGFITSHADWLE